MKKVKNTERRFKHSSYFKILLAIIIIVPVYKIYFEPRGPARVTQFEQNYLTMVKNNEVGVMSNSSDFFS